MSDYLKEQFNNLKIEFLKVHNKTLCARRNNLIATYNQGIFWRTPELCERIFELTCLIDANGREILRLRGNKWSI